MHNTLPAILHRVSYTLPEVYFHLLTIRSTDDDNDRDGDDDNDNEVNVWLNTCAFVGISINATAGTMTLMPPVAPSMSTGVFTTTM